MYKQAIIIFGMVLPGGALLVGLIISWMALGKFETKRDNKIDAFKQAAVSKGNENKLAGELAPLKGQMEYWKQHLTSDTVQGFIDNHELIMKRFDSNQLRPPNTRRPTGKGALGTGVDADATLFQLTYEGGYGPMQELVAELEVRMPQLVLEQIKISPGQSRGGGLGRKLKFELTYMAWSM